MIDIPVSNGFYVDVRLERDVTADDVDCIRKRMQEIVDARMPIRRYMVPTEDAIALFEEKGDVEKVKLLRTSGSLYTTYYKIGEYVDFYYGTLLTNTSQLYLFGLEKYYDGMLLRIPSLQNPDELGEVTRQDKMFEIFKEHHHWQDIIGIRTVGDFNAAVDAGHATDVINISEALQEKKIAQIAEQIAARPGVKLVLLAGPSSSGKTTSCKRLSIQLAVNGLKPLQISLDDYLSIASERLRTRMENMIMRVSMPSTFRRSTTSLMPSSVVRRWNCLSTISRAARVRRAASDSR